MERFEKFYAKSAPILMAGGQFDSLEIFCDAVLHRALSYIKLGDPELGADDCSLLISIEGAPYKDLAYHYRAKLHAKEQQWWKCIEDNTNALKINGRLANAFLDRSIAYERVGMQKESQRDKVSYDVLKREIIWSCLLYTSPSPRDA
eukprot:TRINITY_DN3354_c0_g1_i1.p1 TRINITY_DN3354_c0_g1~~TRINITY_DN3354_c0_g1_i1.p1  ORF type:complete len:156 (-),score=33.95 TRINITY_DN3354_c0_g1_i1:14-454(-)